MESKLTLEKLKAILTLEKLKAMKPDTMFASGVDQGEFHSIRWAAVRGGIHDWVIYYAESYHNIEYVIRQGDKIMTSQVIKRLVPCDDEAFEMYRY